MKITQVFWLADYISYLWRSHSRHGTHSPFIYHFADNILYQKLEPSDIDLLELWRSEIMEISWKHQVKTSIITPFHQFPQKKYLTLLYRILKSPINNGLFLEIGQSSFSVPRIWESAGCHSPYLHYSDFIFDHPLTFSESYETEINQLYPQLPIQNLVRHFEGPQNIGFIFVNANIQITDPHFNISIIDKLINQLDNNGVLMLYGMDNDWNQRDLWEKLIKHQRVTAHIDLFKMGIIFVRPEQQKEKFILRY